MQMYTIIRKMYHSTKDMHPDNPYRVVDTWMGVGCDPLTMKEAQIVLDKLCPRNLWIDQIVPIENKDQ